MSRIFLQQTFVHICIVLCITCVLFFTQTYHTHAQAFLPDAGTSVQLIASPQYPEPYSTVEISIDDYSLDTLGSRITWYVDGIESLKDKNERSITIKVGALGERASVRVVLIKERLVPLTTILTIIPKTVDIILESDVYVPYFYKGKGLPSSESTVRAIATVQDGTLTPDTSYTYRWSLDDTVLLGGPVKGKNVLEFTMPHFSDNELLLEVFDTKGVQIEKKVLILDSYEPELHFYEYNALRGLTEKALISPMNFVGEETTIFGEPYFMNSNISESDTTFTWKINGKEVAGDRGVPNALTLERVGESGQAQIGLQAVTKTQIPQFVEDTLQLIFD